MSLNQLYDQIPIEDRICEGCGEPIHRNIAMLNGKLYHWGCLKQTKAKPTHLCLECFSYLTGKGIVKATVGDFTHKACGNCGSFNLKPLTRWKGRSNIEFSS